MGASDQRGQRDRESPVGQREDALHARAQESHGEEIRTLEDFEEAYPELVLKLETEYAGADFDLRETIEDALDHDSATKRTRKDIHVKKWLRREAAGGPGRKRMGVTTDWKQDFFEGTK